MRKTYKNILSMGLAVIMLLGLMASSFSILAAEGDTPDPLQAQYDLNDAKIKAIEAGFAGKLAAIKDMEAIKSLNLFGLTAHDLIAGFINGTEINYFLDKTYIGGASKLGSALFTNSYTWKFPLISGLGGLTSKDVPFPTGMMNGSPSFRDDNNTTHSLPNQTLEAKIAAQEAVLYVDEAMDGMLNLLMAMDGGALTGLSDLDSISSLVDGLRKFLAFENDDFTALKDAAKDKIEGQVTARYRILTLSNYTVSSDGAFDAVMGQYGAYSLFGTLKDSILGLLLGSSASTDDLIKVLDFVYGVTSGELFNKYSNIDFTDVNVGVDGVFGYAIGDIEQVKSILILTKSMSGTLGTLLGTGGEFDIVKLVVDLLGGLSGLGQYIDEFLESVVPGASGIGIGGIISNAFGGKIQSTDDILAILDDVIEALNNLRSGFKGIDGNGLVNFAGSIANGDIYNKYANLDFNSVKDVGTLLKYMRNDVNGANALLKTGHLINTGLSPILGGKTLTAFVQGFINTDLPAFILGLAGSQLQNDQFGISGVITELFGSVNLSGLSFAEAIKVLDCISKILDKIIEEYNWIESVLRFDENDQIDGVDVWKALERVGIYKADIEAMIREAINEIKAEICTFVKEVKNDVKKAYDKIDAKVDAIRNKIEKIALEVKTVISCIRDIIDCVDNTIDWLKNDLPGEIKNCAEEIAAKLIKHVKDEIRDCLEDSKLDKLVGKLSSLCADLKWMAGFIKCNGDIEIIATLVNPDSKDAYLLSTNYDEFIAKLDCILSILGMSTGFEINYTVPAGGPVSLSGNSLTSGAGFIGTAKVSFRLYIPVKGCTYSITLATKEVDLGSCPALTVLPDNIIQGILANVHVLYGAELQDADFVMLDKNGNSIGEAFRVSEGRTVIRVIAPEEIGTYAVVALRNGNIVAKGSVNVVEDESTGIWNANIDINNDGNVVIRFSEVIAAANNFGVSVNGNPAIGTIDTEYTVSTDVAYESLPSGTSVFTVSGIKYPRIYPSYKFTFEVEVVKS